MTVVCVPERVCRLYVTLELQLRRTTLHTLDQTEQYALRLLERKLQGAVHVVVSAVLTRPIARVSQQAAGSRRADTE